MLRALLHPTKVLDAVDDDWVLRAICRQWHIVQQRPQHVRAVFQWCAARASRRRPVGVVKSRRHGGSAPLLTLSKQCACCLLRCRKSMGRVLCLAAPGARRKVEDDVGARNGKYAPLWLNHLPNQHLSLSLLAPWDNVRKTSLSPIDQNLCANPRRPNGSRPRARPPATLQALFAHNGRCHGTNCGAGSSRRVIRPGHQPGRG